MRLRFFVAAIGAAMLSFGVSAHADTVSTFNFSFGNTSDPFSGSGTFTASNTSPGQYLITGITGSTDIGTTAHGISSLLAPGTFPTLTNGGTTPANDNVLFSPEMGGGYFDDNGVAFVLDNGAQVDLYYQAFDPSDAFLLRVNGKTLNEDVTVTVTQVAAATPEPSTVLLFSTGLLGVAGVVRRRVRA